MLLKKLIANISKRSNRKYHSMKSYNIDDNSFKETLQYYGRKKQTNVNLQTLLETGSGQSLNEFESIAIKSSPPKGALTDRITIQIACFLHRELPVRLAHRVVELEAHPLFNMSPSIRNVCSWYKTSFAQLSDTPVPNDAGNNLVYMCYTVYT